MLESQAANVQPFVVPRHDAVAGTGAGADNFIGGFAPRDRSPGSADFPNPYDAQPQTPSSQGYAQYANYPTSPTGTASMTTNTHSTGSYLLPGTAAAAGAGAAGYAGPRSAKEREAFSRTHSPAQTQSQSGPYSNASVSSIPHSAAGGPLTIMNPGPQDDSASGVVVHQDGGRVRMPDDEDTGSDMKEIPPLYETILKEEQRRRDGGNDGAGPSAL